MWLLAIFVVVPIVEIALFIKVGGWLTLWPTLAIVVGTAIVGSALLRWQGTQVLRDLQREMGAMRDPFSPLAHGALILMGGVMMILPGFFTDTVGIALMIPPVRRLVIRLVMARALAKGAVFDLRGTAMRGADGVVEGEFHEIPPENQPKTPPSGWTRH